MLAFTNATQAMDQFAETEADHLNHLRLAIRSALNVSAQSGKIFDSWGLNRDILKTHDYWLEDAMAKPHTHSTLNADDIDLIIPFISNLGRAYSQVMTHSLATDTVPNDLADIEQAGKLHIMLNFFHAQKAKLSYNTSYEPALRNE